MLEVVIVVAVGVAAPEAPDNPAGPPPAAAADPAAPPDAPTPPAAAPATVLLPPPAPCTRRLPLGPIGSPTDDLARIAELTGAAPVRPEMFRRWSSTPELTLCDGGLAPHPDELPEPLPSPLRLEPLPLGWRAYENTGYPDDRNDGAIWQGRGLSTEATGGVRLRWRFFSAAVDPIVAWQENRSFYRPAMNMPGYSPYANPFYYGNIDLPLRFGPRSFWTFDPGQSYARIDLFNVALGFSTENLWWGPGIRSSLLMSNTAPGFPHVFLGTSKPQYVWLGWVEAQLVWGRLSESKWFDTDPTDDRRHFTSLNVGFEPYWIPGLFIGFTRVYVYRIPPGGLDFGRTIGEPLFNPFFKEALATADNPLGNSPDNQLASIAGRWVFAPVGLEIYGEWGRDDHSWNFRDLVTTPSHSAAWLFGLQKVFAVGGGWIRFQGECAQTLEVPPENEIPNFPTAVFYSHYYERQGYTNDGQMLGAAMGGQGTNQYVALDWLHSRGRLGGWFERVQRNGRYYWDQPYDKWGQDVELDGGLRGSWSWREVDLDARAGVGHRYNFDLRYGKDRDNYQLMLAVTWWPGRAEIPALPPRAPGPTPSR